MKWHIHHSALENRSLNIGNAKADDPRLIHSFRLLDDDGIVYFNGSASELNFNPLDDYGVAFGCTEMQHLNHLGEWETL